MTLLQILWFLPLYELTARVYIACVADCLERQERRRRQVRRLLAEHHLRDLDEQDMS